MSAPATPRHGDPLTPREIDVLYWTARGLRNAGVARKLFLSTDSVKTHLKRIFIKFGAVDRAHLIALAFTAGYLSTGPGGQVLAAGHDTDEAA